MINYTGLNDTRICPILAEKIKEKSQSIVIVPGMTRAQRLAKDLSFFMPDRKIFVLPEEENVFLKYEAKNQDQLIEKMRAEKALLNGEDCIVISPVSAVLKKIPKHEDILNKEFKLKVGEEIEPTELARRLVDMGYEHSDMVYSFGQFSIRGGISDIFTSNEDNPYRIEFFGDEIDSIRAFDVDTQRSIENVKEIEIYPIDSTSYEDYFKNAKEFIWDYAKDALIAFDDPERSIELVDLREKELREDYITLLDRGEITKEEERLITGFKDLKPILDRRDTVIFTPLPKRIKGIDRYDELHNVNARQVLAFNGNLTLLENEIKAYLKKGYEISIVINSDTRIENLKEFILRSDLLGKLEFKKGELSSGIDLVDLKKVWITDKEIFNNSKKKKRRREKNDNGLKIKSFTDLKSGDFVVHENHGIGKFIGIEEITFEGEKKDYIKIKYAGNDLLYVPVEQLDYVQKYIGGDNRVPKINRLSGTDWYNTKVKAKAAIAVLAKDLIDLYAERKINSGYSFGPDTVWQREFEESFPFEETADQLKSSEEIKRDMEKPFPMDRLLLGDVGFGKTEVAARAIFKCISEGKQAAVLVPTTILANQHFYTLKERFSNFPFKVEVLSRFKTDKEQKEIISELKTGQIDLVIGTHKLLSKEVEFLDLGLLVVDEEQRFGVEHKEKIKKLKTNVDVLTLSATPIPRTLNMSLTGIKDMSVIEEPPEERYPVQTYVVEEDDILLKEVIERELARNGQVFVVFNRVKGIQKVAERIEELVPDSSVIVGHGQMSESTLENAMIKFIDGEYNVLVSTTIIESGIDIPNVNTMVILDADRYGLSQLYQLRGRVGRTNRQAYCYLMYQKDKVLTEEAEKRLRAIKEFTEFGSGFKVAMRDLEIRGAGNMLGTEQSGHMMNIGYEMYCKMVDDAVKALEGKIVTGDRKEITLEFPISSHIPSTYIENETQKLEMYKKIAAISSREDEEDLVDEMIDRYGDIPKSVLNLMKIAYIRFLAEKLAITDVKQRDNKVTFSFDAKNPLSGFALMNAQERFGLRLFIHSGKMPFVRLSVSENKNLKDSVELLELLVDNMVQ